jgi:hypothetical protein
MAVCDHLKSPCTAFIWRQEKDGPQTPDHKLDDCNAFLNIKTRLQLQLFFAGEVEGLFDAGSEYLQQARALTLSAPFLFFCNLTVRSRYDYAGLFEHIYERLFHGRTS